MRLSAPPPGYSVLPGLALRSSLTWYDGYS
jgi:hypothetical protein